MSTQLNGAIKLHSQRNAEKREPTAPVPTRVVTLVLVLLLLSALSLPAQPVTVTTTGTVVSSMSATIIVKPEGRTEVLFVMNNQTVKPKTIPLGSTVKVVSAADSEGLQVAQTITIITQAPEKYQPTEPIPAEVREMESEIQKAVRRFGVGVRGGVALDPELVMIGGQARFGPFFSSNFSFRPSLEAGWGESTTLIAVNLEGIYRLPVTMSHGKWSTYFGAGAGLNFNKRGLPSGLVASGSNVEIDTFKYETTLNILVGVQKRSGLFSEVRASAFGKPAIRLFIGYNW